jgi:hypothetical protein
MKYRGALTEEAAKAKATAKRTGIEVTCAGCGLILATYSLHDIRARQATCEALGRQALRKHVATTQCTGEPPKDGHTPRRRDGRCLYTVDYADNAEVGPTPIRQPQAGVAAPHLGLPAIAEHVHGCRCDLEQRPEDVFQLLPRAT